MGLLWTTCCAKSGPGRFTYALCCGMPWAVQILVAFSREHREYAACCCLTCPLTELCLFARPSLQLLQTCASFVQVESHTL